MTLNPATDLALSGWWKPDYAHGSSWTDSSSKSPGASGGHTLSGGSSPTVATFNGFNVAQFDPASSTLLATTVHESDLWTASRGEFAIHFFMQAADLSASYASGAAGAKGDPYLLGGAGGYSAISVHAGGVKAGIDDGTGFKGVSLSSVADGWHTLFGYWDGTNFYLALDGDTLGAGGASVAVGNLGDLTSVLKMGNSQAYGFSTGGYGKFQVAEIMTAKQSTAGIVANKAGILAYFTAKYTAAPITSIDSNGVLQTTYGTPDSRVVWNSKASDNTDVAIVEFGSDILQVGSNRQLILAGNTNGVYLQAGWPYNPTDTNLRCDARNIRIDSPEWLEQYGDQIGQGMCWRSHMRGYQQLAANTTFHGGCGPASQPGPLGTIGDGECRTVDGIITAVNSDGTKAGSWKVSARIRKLAGSNAVFVTGPTVTADVDASFGGAAATIAFGTTTHVNDLYVSLTGSTAETVSFGWKIESQIQRFSGAAMP